MSTRGIPWTYQGIPRNILREPNGNPGAVTRTDSNAARYGSIDHVNGPYRPQVRSYRMPQRNLARWPDGRA
ncbi:hypothetical protein ACFCV9_00590 [Streptomyces sp. NPDC056367]|uniref:hypothetical protein n=1 Tax=Streptomyces sp. NPDC056367 TaxID=3345797 RepID=UPI0035DD839C